MQGILAGVGLDHVHVVLVLLEDVIDQPPRQQGVELGCDIFAFVEALVQTGDAVDEGIVHPLVGVEEFVACIAHHDFLEAEVGERVVHDVVDDLLEHVAVLPELCLVELVEVVDDATMLIVDLCNAQVQLGGPFNVRHA